jgi:hypothetical protein
MYNVLSHVRISFLKKLNSNVLQKNITARLSVLAASASAQKNDILESLTISRKSPGGRQSAAADG